MDLKIDSISPSVMKIALEQAKEGRLHILQLMKDALAEGRGEVSDYAPRMLTMKINPEKIRDVIGKGGRLSAVCRKRRARSSRSRTTARSRFRR